MATDDFFRARLDQMIDLSHPLVVLSQRMPWPQIEAALAPHFSRPSRAGKTVAELDLFGPSVQLAGSGPSAAGRPRLPIRLMAALLYLKHAFGLSDEELVERWSENVVWQYFSGQDYYCPRLPCDATQIGRFRTAIGEAGVEELLKASIDAAVQMKAIDPEEFTRVIVDTTVQEKAIAHPVDSRLLEVARRQLVEAAKALGLTFKQTYAKECAALRRKAGGYAHAKQFRRLRRIVKRQRTILGVLLRESQRKLEVLMAQMGGEQIAAADAAWDKALARLHTVMQRAWRVHDQRPKDKNKLYALHAPEVECIGKGKARKPYEFGVKVSLAVTHQQGLVVGARSFTGNPYDGHILHAQLEQSRILMEDVDPNVAIRPLQAVVDLGFRGVDWDNPGVEIIHRGKIKQLSAKHRKWLKRRQAIEPVIGHLKDDNGMRRCWLKGSLGDALNAVLCAAGFNLRWLMRAVTRLGLLGLFAALFAMWAIWGWVLAAWMNVEIRTGAYRHREFGSSCAHSWKSAWA